MSTSPEANGVVAKPTLVGSLKAVAWSFIGIRSRAGFQEDALKVNPLHVLLAGILGVLVLVVSLIGLATWVVGK
ncbi:MAG: DUF2970 domain-containing protein [Betaproteobacteria bacterium]|jgi:uncharacterized membrane protein YdcZ (DUF606 family)